MTTNTRKNRQPRRRHARLTSRIGAHLESLECRRMLAGDIEVMDVEGHPPFSGAISGTKWEDANRDGQRDRGEPGLAGVTIYLDENLNGRLDRGEPHTVSGPDDPNTDADESGHYTLDGLDEGRYVVREVVPEGFVQTFPVPVVTDNLPRPIRAGGHVVHVPGGEHVTDIDFGNYRRDTRTGSVHGVKWEDTNGNGVRDNNEPGLAGVIIFSDLNRNGQLDRNEPLTRTSRDIPETDFDETGLYELGGLRPGGHLIREVAPDGYVQSFPPKFDVLPTADDVDAADDPFASANPRRLDFVLEAGDEVVEGVSFEVHPFCILPIDVDVVASDPDISFSNLSGVQSNGCGGDISKFEVSVTGDGGRQEFEILFVDATSRHTYASIPVTVNSPYFRGAHRVIIEPDGGVDGIDFGNRPVATSAIHGQKWLDANGNGEHEDDEPGLAGVTIYLDLNNNGHPDEREPATFSARDNPLTPEDETGRYRFGGLREGEYIVREVVPRGHIQTFPGVGAEVLHTHSGSFNPGNAIGLDVTDVAASVNDDGSVDADVEVSVTWPDSCGMLKEGETAHSVVGNHLLIEVSGQQVGEGCSEVETTLTEHVEFGPLRAGRYDVTVTLHEDLADGEGIPTLNVVGRLAVGSPGYHRISLGASEVVEGVDFGNQSELETASVHGVKWLDRNGNGKRDRGEPGVAGITVFSDVNLNGQFDADEPHAVTMADDGSTRIDEAGHYWLGGLEPGAHLITEVLPEGFERTFPPPSDILAPWPLNEPYYFPNLVAGQMLTGIDFGNHPVKVEGGTLHGRKWADVDGNGVHDEGEPGLPGVTIYLDVNLNNQFDPREPAVRTRRDNPETDFDETGLYSFSAVEPGFYIVREVVPQGFQQTFPEIMACEAVFCSGRGHIVNVEPGQSLDGLDFGNRPVREPGSVHGIKWADINGNGQREDDEAGLPGVIIFADQNLNGRRDGDEPFTTTIKDDPDTETNEAGRYALRLLPGEHLIMEVVPGGYQQTFPNPHRRIAHPFNLGHLVQVQPGAPTEAVNFGNQPVLRPAAVEGVKWLDRNGNGERDRNERGLAGVVIYSDLNGNAERDAGEPATRTRRDNPRTGINESGYYRLELSPGEHLIREALPHGFRQTFPTGPTQVLETESTNLPPGRAIGFDLVDASLDRSARGDLGLQLTFAVTWPDGCGHLVRGLAGAKVDGDSITVQMFGTNTIPNNFCTLGIETQTQTLRVDAPPPGKYQVNAVLKEGPLPEHAFEESFLLAGVVGVGPGAGHVINLEPGQTVENRNFGNQPVGRFHVADFDLDGHVDAVDIDLLALAVRGQNVVDDFDLSGDGDVNEKDTHHLIREVLEIPYGDSNLDGRFDSSDIVQVFQAGKYEDDELDNASWAEGDWDGDGDFTSSDIVFVFQHGGYQTDARAVDQVFAD